MAKRRRLLVEGFFYLCFIYIYIYIYIKHFRETKILLNNQGFIMAKRRRLLVEGFFYLCFNDNKS